MEFLCSLPYLKYSETVHHHFSVPDPDPYKADPDVIVEIVRILFATFGSDPDTL